MKRHTKLGSITTESDKISRHGYHRFYPIFFDSLDCKQVRLLEIGYHLGNSIDLWVNYFDDVEIYSIDIKNETEVQDSRIKKYHKVDQSKNIELDSFCKKINTKFDIIIDDGSHVPEHQWNTFIRFFGLLNDGGIYIIEDIETSFWGRSNAYGYEFNAKKTSLFNHIKKIYMAINSEFVPPKTLSIPQREIGALHSIEMASICHNCIIFKKKDRLSYSNFYRTHDDYPMHTNINKSRYKTLNYIRSLTKKLLGR